MPIGKTQNGVEALGSIILIYYRDEFLMGRETTFLTDDKDVVANYKTNDGETIYAGFLSPGQLENDENSKTAKRKFARTCVDIEKKLPDIPRVTYADLKNSRTNPGFITAKPRYVVKEKRYLYGFPKGSYENKDATLQDTIIRECSEETNIDINPERLIDTGILAPNGKKTSYAVFHYKLTKPEYEKFLKIIEEKNKSRENELHNIQFIKIPTTNLKDFFINSVSKDAYSLTITKNKQQRISRSNKN
jgi:8-oxo-dGTP pyrophosphatase MutT (NUDIX family)